METKNGEIFKKVLEKKYLDLIRNVVKFNKVKSGMKLPIFLKRMSINLFIKLTSTFMQSLISLLTIVIYIVSTYYDEDKISNPNDIFMIQTLNKIEVFVAFYIAIFFIINLYIQKKKLAYIFNVLNILDIMTVFPIFFKFFFPNTVDLSFTKIFRLFRLARASRIFKIIKKVESDTLRINSKNNQKLRIFTAIGHILFFVFLVAGILQYISNNEYFDFQSTYLNGFKCDNDTDLNNSILNLKQESLTTQFDCGNNSLFYDTAEFTFDEAFYYMIITILTVGYGDTIPVTMLGRLLMSIIIVVGLILSSTYNEFIMNIFRINYNMKISYNSSSKHIIITGIFNEKNLKKCLDEIFLHKEKINNFPETKIVVIQPCNNKGEIENVIQNPNYDNQIYLVKGEITDQTVHRLSNLPKSDAIFILSDNFHNNPKENDYFTLMMCIVLSSYPKPELYVQFNLSKYTDYGIDKYEQALSSKLLKNTIIIKNSFISGLSSMIMNMYSPQMVFGSNIFEEPWYLEYVSGASHNIVFVPICQKLENLVFKEVVMHIYFSSNDLVIGVKRKAFYKDCVKSEIFEDIIRINPVDYVLNKDDELIMLKSDLKRDKKNQNLSKDDEKINRVRKLCDKEDISNLFTEETNFTHLRTEKSFKKYRSDSNLINNLELRKYDSLRKDEKEKKNHFRVWEKNILNKKIKFENHYLILAKEEELEEFMKVFSQYSSNTIIFLSILSPSSKWEKISKIYPNIYYIQLKLMIISEFKNLNIHLASHMYVLTTNDVKCHMSVSQILTCVKLLREKYPSLKMTIEIPTEINLCPSFQKTYTRSETQDNLLSNIIRVPLRMSAEFTSSEFFFSSFVDTLLPYTYFNKYTLPVLNRLLDININDINSYLKENKELRVLKYIDKSQRSYGEILYMLINQENSVIPIGLYRNKKCPILKNSNPYIITNPDVDLYLNEGDEVICIGVSTFSKKKTENIIRNKGIFSSKKSIFLNDDDYKFIQEQMEEEDLLKTSNEEFFQKFNSHFNEFDKAKLLFKNSLIEDPLNDSEEESIVKRKTDYTKFNANEENLNNLSEEILNLSHGCSDYRIMSKEFQENDVFIEKRMKNKKHLRKYKYLKDKHRIYSQELTKNDIFKLMLEERHSSESDQI